jgi:Xaa-Pro aminopeptidase
MAADIIKEKVRQASSLLREFQIDCWITFVRETELLHEPILDFLVPNTLTWHSALIITATGKSIAIVGKYDRQTLVDSGVYDRVVDYVEGIRAPLLAEFRSLAPRTIALNYSVDSEICDGITHGMFLTMMDILGEAGMGDRVVSAERILSALRQRKSTSELANIREAIRHTEEIYAYAGSHLKSGLTEEDVAVLMREEVRKRGLGYAWDPVACPAVFTGPDTALAHYKPTDRVIEPGHLVYMDFGVRVNGYVSDVQRVFYVLREDENAPPPEVQRGFDTLVEAIERARAILKPGAKGVDVDNAARSCLVAAGYEAYPHGLGHQVGRFAHDGTALLGPPWEKYARKPFVPIEENMVFTLEPSLAVAGHGSVSIEEMVLVTPTGAEYMTTPQKTLHCVK